MITGRPTMLRRALLVSGALSSLLYVAIDQVAAIRYGGYHSFTTQTISELMARGAPTKSLVDPLFVLYGVLVIAFAAGVWRASGDNRALRITAGLLLAYAVAGLPGPAFFPMNVRGAGDQGGNDVGHIILTAVLVLFILASVSFGAFALGRRFRLYSFATIALMLLFGALVGTEAKGIATGAPTPFIGLFERANIGAFLAWMAVFSITLLRRGASSASGDVVGHLGKLESGVGQGALGRLP
jgi:hypothetical protein